MSRPYTPDTLDLVEGAISKANGGRDDDQVVARYVLDALAVAGLLVTPRIERDARMLGCAYIWRRPGFEPVVLDPAEVDVVLPLEAT